MRRWAAEAQGVAKPGTGRQHVPASLERVAVWRALEMCHILESDGRAYR